MQRYFTNIKYENTFVLNNDDMYHIKTVMRMKDGDNIEVVYQKKLYLCQLNDNYSVNIKDTISEEYNKETYYILCLPLLTEQKMSLVLQKATELGVDEIIPIETQRSIVRIDGKADKKLDRWNRICKEASEQSKRVDIPKIWPVKKLEDLSLEGLKIVCSTIEKENTIKKVLKNNKKCDRIIIVVGPEGGLSLEEEKKLNNIGFISTSLGENIMRVETVPIYMLSVLNYELME